MRYVCVLYIKVGQEKRSHVRFHFQNWGGVKNKIMKVSKDGTYRYTKRQNNLLWVEVLLDDDVNGNLCD